MRTISKKSSYSQTDGVKDRLGSFGDIVFGLMLAGIVAAYIPLFSNLLKNGGSTPSLAQFGSALWVEETPLVQFISISALWMLQARTVTRLFVDHVAFITVYSLMLLWLFCWVMVESIIPVVIASQSMKPALPSLITSPFLLLSFSFCSLLILGVGGLAYHWFWLSCFDRYECIRDCLMILTGVVVTGFLGTDTIKIKSPLDLMEIASLVLALRLLIAVEVDPYALRKWGSDEEQSHQTRVLFAGRILVMFFALAATVLTWIDPVVRSLSFFWLISATLFIVSSWGIPKHLHNLRLLYEESASNAAPEQENSVDGKS